MGDIFNNVLVYVIAMHFVLSGVDKGLELLLDKIPGDTDKKIWEWVHKAVLFLKGVIDFMQGNRQHK